MNSTRNIYVAAGTPTGFKPAQRGAIWVDSTNNQICYIDEAGNVNCITSGGSAVPLYYGSFYDTTTQQALLPDTAYPMKLGITDVASGVTVASDGTNLTRITAAHTGVYNLQFSAQVWKTQGGSAETMSIWLDKMGSPIADTATKLTFANNTEYTVAAWNWVVSLTGGQYVQIMWAVTSVKIEMPYVAASGVVPGVPSVIATMNRVG